MQAPHRPAGCSLPTRMHMWLWQYATGQARAVASELLPGVRLVQHSTTLTDLCTISHQLCTISHQLCTISDQLCTISYQSATILCTILCIASPQPCPHL